VPIRSKALTEPLDDEYVNTVPVFAWNTISYPPRGDAAMLGLVLASMPSVVLVAPLTDEYIYKIPVFA
jgi:hypothetical protein